MDIENINGKKYILSLFVTVLGLVFLISGTSYAILKGTVTSNDTQIIKSGSVELMLSESYDNLDIGIPILSDVDGLLQPDLFNFSITNIGNVGASYDLKLVNSATGEKLNDSDIKVGLEVNGDEFGPMTLSAVKNVIDSEDIYPNEVIHYAMRLWLNEDNSSNITASKNAVLSLKIDAKQVSYSSNDRGESSV